MTRKAVLTLLAGVLVQGGLSPNAFAETEWQVSGEGRSAAFSIEGGQFSSLSIACGTKGDLIYKIDFGAKSYGSFFIDLDEDVKVFKVSKSGQMNRKDSADFDRYVEGIEGQYEAAKKAGGDQSEKPSVSLQTADQKKSLINLANFLPARSEVIKNCKSGQKLQAVAPSATPVAKSAYGIDVGGFSLGESLQDIKDHLQKEYKSGSLYDNYSTPPSRPAQVWIARGTTLSIANGISLLDSMGIWFSDPGTGSKALGIDHFQQFDARLAPSREQIIDALTRKYGQQSYATPAVGSPWPSIFWWYKEKDDGAPHPYNPGNSCESIRMPNLVSLFRARGVLQLPPADMNKSVMDFKREFYGSARGKDCHGQVIRAEIGLIPNDQHRFTWMTVDAIDIDAIAEAEKTTARAHQDAVDRFNAAQARRPYGAVPKL